MMDNMKKAELRQYEMYKNTGIELTDTIPSHWELYKAKFIFKHIIEYSKTGEEELLSVSEYYGVAAKAEMNEDSEFLTRAATLEGYKKNNKNDLIINIMLAWKRALGVAPIDGIVSPAYAVFRIIDLEKHDPRYYHYLLRTELYATEFRRFSTGIIDSRLRLYPESFNNIILLTPPYTEQVVISKFLDHEINKIDDTIEKSQRLIQLLKEQRLALIHEAVTKGLNSNTPYINSEVDWLSLVPKHWGIKKIRRMTKIRRGLFSHRPRNDPEMYDGPYPFIQTGDISSTNKYINNYTQTLSEKGKNVSKCFPKGTLVMTIAGANVGVIAILNFDAYFPDSVVGFEPDEDINIDYLYYLFISMKQAFLSTATVNTQPNLNIERIGELCAVLPPKKEQQEISNYVEKKESKIKLLIEKNEAQIAKLQEYRHSLIREAVTGKIQIREMA